MSEERTSTFQTALEMVDKLELEEKEMLFDIAYRRFIEQRRMCLAEEVAEARQAYRQGEVRRGTVDDLLAELAVVGNVGLQRELLYPHSLRIR